MKRVFLVIPLVIFLGLAAFLYRGLFLDPSTLPSALIGKPFPSFHLPAVDNAQRILSAADFQGQAALVNVWATWCVACKVEHPVLNSLTQQGVVIYGINYKDDPAAAQQWLKAFHNPYQLNVQDAEGRLGLNLGVYGAPETFLIDKQGIIRHKYVGIIDQQVWREQLAPLYQELASQ